MASKEKIQDAGIRTYSYYAHAFCLYPETLHDLKEAQNALPDFQAIQRIAQATEDLKRHLHRGFLTLQYIKVIPVDEMPEIGMAAALWIPVQVYYAVHGFGLVALAAISKGGKLPGEHGEFLRETEKNLVRRLLPDPFVARLKDGFNRCGFMDFNKDNLLGLKLDCDPDDWPCHLELPNRETRIPHIARCLSMTRERELKEKFKRKRGKINRKRAKKGKRGKNLSRMEKVTIAIAPDTGHTTVFDYLYRIRLQSNYQNPRMFDLGSEHKDIVIDFVKNNQKMASRLCYLLLRVIERGLNDGDCTKLINEWKNRIKWEA